MNQDIYTYSDALKIGNAYIPVSAPEPPGASGTPVFAMTRPALENTLSYIFHYLHHVCYMVCVSASGAIKMHKLVHKTTAPVFKKAIHDSIQTLTSNPYLSPKQRKDIAKTLSVGNWRIMQCIVKKYKKEPAEGTTNVYLTILRKAGFLPPGVFIFNLTDAIILRADGYHPFDSVVREKCPDEYITHPHIPILSLSGRIGYHDIVIPNYDDLLYITRTKAEISKDIGFETQWSRKIPTAVFRGGVTGCGTTPETNMRLRIAEMDDPPRLDAGISIHKSAKVQSGTIRFDPKYGVSMINSALSTKPRIELFDQSKCKYIIHIDGNVHAYRFLKMMLTGSLTLRVKSQYTSWMDNTLREFEHYIPVSADLSNLDDVLDWCRDHDTECRQIAEAGRIAAESALTQTTICTFIRNAMWNAAPSSISLVAASLSTDELRAKPSGMGACNVGYATTRIAGKSVCKKRGDKGGGGGRRAKTVKRRKAV